MKGHFGIGGIILTFLVNLIANIWWSIPAWVLLALHFILSVPIYWFVLALLLWIVPTVIFGLFVGIAAASAAKQPFVPTVKVKLRDGERNPFEPTLECTAE